MDAWRSGPPGMTRIPCQAASSARTASAQSPWSARAAARSSPASGGQAPPGESSRPPSSPAAREATSTPLSSSLHSTRCTRRAASARSRPSLPSPRRARSASPKCPPPSPARQSSGESVGGGPLGLGRFEPTAASPLSKRAHTSCNRPRHARSAADEPSDPPLPRSTSSPSPCPAAARKMPASAADALRFAALSFSRCVIVTTRRSSRSSVARHSASEEPSRPCTSRVQRSSGYGASRSSRASGGTGKLRIARKK
mmetsp:Transcript_89468/g.253505  ORF Transcript_89468/g.253505 Transcript_89468/m.253505 type:complete len:255 (-) Transcript_89468:1529-2293(-)